METIIYQSTTGEDGRMWAFKPFIKAINEKSANDFINQLKSEGSKNRFEIHKEKEGFWNNYIDEMMKQK